jgi:hypothetical protein
MWRLNSVNGRLSGWVEKMKGTGCDMLIEKRVDIGVRQWV